MKDAVERFLAELRDGEIDLHSMVLICDGEIVDERYFGPFGRDTLGCYGKGGQFILCYPDKRLALVTTADTTSSREGNQMIFDSLYRNIFPVCISQRASEDKKAFLQAPNSFLLNMGNRYECQKGTAWDWLEFSQEKVRFGKGEKGYELLIGWEEKAEGKFPLYGDPCMTKAVWLDSSKSTFRIDIKCFERK